MKNYIAEIRWGLIFTLVFLLWMGFEKAMGWHGPKIEDHPTYTNLFMIPVALIYYLAIREKRDRFYGGVMSWKQGLLSGCVLTGVVVFLSPFAQWIFHALISPEYFPNVREYAVKEGKMSMEKAKEHFNFLNYMVMSTVGNLLSGVVLSMLIARVLRRKGGGTD